LRNKIFYSLIATWDEARGAVAARSGAAEEKPLGRGHRQAAPKPVWSPTSQTPRKQPPVNVPTARKEQIQSTNQETPQTQRQEPSYFQRQEPRTFQQALADYNSPGVHHSKAKFNAIFIIKQY